MRMLASIQVMAVFALASVLLIGTLPASETLAAVLFGPCGAGVASHDHRDHAAGGDRGCQHEPATAPASKDCSQMSGCVVLPASALAEPPDSAITASSAGVTPAGVARLAGRAIPPDISPPIARI